MKKILGTIVIIFFIIGFSKVCLADNTKDVSADSYKYDYEDIIIKKGNEDEKVVALTFDDGPDEVFTPQVLDILKKYDVKATFFLIGEKVQYNKKIVKREKEEGHEIGNHTFTHNNPATFTTSYLDDKNTKTNNNVKINSEVSGNTPLPTSSVSENSDKKNKINYWYYVILGIGLVGVIYFLFIK